MDREQMSGYQRAVKGHGNGQCSGTRDEQHGISFTSVTPLLGDQNHCLADLQRTQDFHGDEWEAVRRAYSLLQAGETAVSTGSEAGHWGGTSDHPSVVSFTLFPAGGCPLTALTPCTSASGQLTA